MSSLVILAASVIEISCGKQTGRQINAAENSVSVGSEVTSSVSAIRAATTRRLGIPSFTACSSDFQRNFYTRPGRTYLE